MLSRVTAAVIGLMAITGGAFAQTGIPAAPHPQPRSTVPPDGTAAAASPGSTDLDATRKRFEANAAKQAESDRKRDAKLNISMRSICAGCDAPSAKRVRP